MGTLHFYAQEGPHDVAYVAGTKKALILLRDAIDRALSSGRSEFWTFASDGEGYAVIVHEVCDSLAARLAVPYMRDEYMERSREAIRPFDLDAAKSDLAGDDLPF